jgi:hypothetical protein
LRAGRSYDPRTIDSNCAPGGHTRAAILFSVAILALGFISSCGYGPNGSVVNPNVVVTITPQPGGIPQGTSLVFNATVTGDSANKGVTWYLAPTSGAGTLTNISSLSVTYNAPATPPLPNQVALSATSVTYGINSGTEFFSVTVPGLTTTITNKISTINAGGQPVTLNVTVANDPRNAGVNWAITTPTVNCGPTACGTLSNQTAFSVMYTPPATFPSSPFNMPYIQANSMTDPTEFDRNSFTIH